MATVSQVVSSGLKSIIVLGSEASLESEDAQDFIFAMNNFMFDLESKGVRLGWTNVSNLGDTVTIPAGALRGLIANVAVEVAPDYGGVVSPALQMRAISGLKAMYQLGVKVIPSAFPSTLPIGSGNEDNNKITDEHFYTNLEASILAEASGIPSASLILSGNTSATTISTIGTSVLVAGAWGIDRNSQLTATAAGKISSSLEDTFAAALTANLNIAPVVATNQIISAYFVLNGVVISASRAQIEVSVGLPETLTLNYGLQLKKSDYIEVFIANDTSTDNLLVSSATLKAN